MADEMFSPELLQALADAGLLPQIMELAGHQVQRGNQMADTPMPQGRVYEPGYQAPHPLEYVSAILRRGRGEQMAQQGSQQAQGALSGYAKAAQDYYRALNAPAAKPAPPQGDYFNPGTYGPAGGP